jgi:major membrane immunogen (membrane-anchored lipoprotein)
MKKIIRNLTLVLLVLITSCSSSTDTVDYSKMRPDDVPKNLPPVWTYHDQKAYEEGRMFFNDDSTIMMITDGRPGLDLNNFDSKNVEIVVK